MNHKDLNQLASQIETHIECWKQFNRFVNVARTRKFGPVEENQFLEIKSVIVQELELIFASVEVSSPSRDDIHNLVGNAPSLKALSEMNDGSLRGFETQWHKVYIGWHAILGQIKVKQRGNGSKSIWGAKK
jgi:hypothetical protein